jgi:cell division protein FtsA
MNAHAHQGELALEERPLAPLIAALDIGVSKTTCLATRRDPVLDMHPDKPMRVLGVGVQAAPAMASGKAADFDACARAVRVALEEASLMAGAPIARVMASYSGPGLCSDLARAGVRVRGKVITERDLAAALMEARRSVEIPGRSVMHVEPLRYFVDDGEPVADPVGQSGKRLTAEACVVTAPSDALQALRDCVKQAGSEIDDIVAGPLASGLAALTEEERDAGALVLDLGAGAIGMAVFAEEGLVHAETFAMGGVRVTRDLAKKLETTFAAAERVKLTYGVVGGGFDPQSTVPAPRIGMDGRLEQSATLRGVLAEIMAPRFHDMLSEARQRLARAGFIGANSPHRAVLSGGGAQAAGAREMASEILGMPVRVGRPFDLSGLEHGEAGPAFATAAGLLRWRFEHPALDDVEHSFAPSLGEALRAMRAGAGGAVDWLKRNF